MPHNSEYDSFPSKIREIGKFLNASEDSIYGFNSIIFHILTDSRSVFMPEDTLFAALRTDLGDGHKYIRELYKKNVRNFLVEDIPDDVRDMPCASFLKVPSVPTALATLAKKKLNGFERGVIVTGSVGKTKVKELIYQAILPHKKVSRSPRSWNSRIGVPLGVLASNFDSFSAWHITEVGIDGPGQAALAHDILADSHKIGVITPITEEHDKEFSSHADKIREKIAIVADCDYIIYCNSELTDELTKITENRPGISLVLVSQHTYPTIYHALAQAAIDVMGVDDADVSEMPLVDSRREVQKGAFGNNIIADFFTPDIMTLVLESLDFMRRQVSTMKDSVLVLGTLFDEAQMQAAMYYARKYGVERIFQLGNYNVNLIPEDNHYSFTNYCSPQEFLERYHAGKLFCNSNIMLFGTGREFAHSLTGAGHDTVMEVNLDAVVHNYNYYRHLLPAGTGIVGMVKASAYGMGAVEIGRTLQSQGAAYLAVAVIDEAIDLRNNGITMPIMVLNPVTNQIPALFTYNIEPAVFSIEELNLLMETARHEGIEQWPIHIKLDTGMHRVGFIESQLGNLVEALKGQNELRVASVFSHLATADCLDMDAYTHSQLDKFYAMTDRIEEGLGYGFKRHILNTAGMMRFADCGPYQMGRLGLGLYGVSPLPGECPDLQTVATFKTRIISLKHWPAGTPIGYGCRGITARDSIVATVPVGYADGLNRGLGRGKASFSVKGVQCPTVGSICMDLCMIDVTDVPEVTVGDEIEIFGEKNSVENLADILGTIPYELFTWVSPRVKRIYYRK